MSHFSVLVIGDDPDDQLAPFHEFECTGRNDKYVQDLDITDEARSSYETDKTAMVRLPDGTLIGAYDDRFYRDPTPEEVTQKKVGLGTGTGNGLSWHSRDWNDGKGYRAKVRFLPEGCERVDVPTSQVKSFRDFAQSYHDYAVVLPGETPDIGGSRDEKGKHKYGYVAVDAAGAVLKVIRRTNPDRKWDWYVVGGRYSGRLLHKDGRSVDQLSRRDWDIEGQIEAARTAAGADWDKVMNGITTPWLPWAHFYGQVEAKALTMDEARAAYHEQPARQRAIANDRDAVWDTDSYLVPRQDYMAAAGARAVGSYAMLIHGHWHAQGEMGWFGMDKKSGDVDDWYKFCESTVRAQPPETLITMVDCHI